MPPITRRRPKTIVSNESKTAPPAEDDNSMSNDSPIDDDDEIIEEDPSPRPKRGKGSKRRISIEDSDEDMPSQNQKRRKRKDSSSSEDDDEEDLDENGNIKDLIDYDCEDDDDPVDITLSEEEFVKRMLIGALLNGYIEGSDEDNNDEDDACPGNRAPGGHLSIFGGPRNLDGKKTILQRIEESKMSDELKAQLSNKFKTTGMDKKAKEWFECILGIPFGVHSILPLVDKLPPKVTKYFQSAQDSLNEAVFGLSSVKEEIIGYLAQCVSNSSPSPRILALQGNAGVGKTQLVRNGIAKALGRPMKAISMGGTRDSAFYTGFEYTYLGSKPGAIIQGLIDCKTMNPIFFFDELDKVSDTKEGQEIENFLIHITDPVQNHDFQDKYLQGIPVDLSKCMFIFSLNYLDKINPILRDRLHVIKIPNPTVEDKLHIAKLHLIKEVAKNIDPELATNVIFSDETLRHMITMYAHTEHGVRTLKRCIESVLLKINTLKLLRESPEIKLSYSLKSLEFPITLKTHEIDNLLKNENIGNDLAYLSMYS